MCEICGQYLLHGPEGLYSLSAGSAGTNQELATYLTTGFWSDFSWSPRKWNLSNSGTYAKNGVITFNTSANLFDSDGLSASRATLVEESFKYLEEVTGIDFQSTTDVDSDFRFGDEESGASASWSYLGGNINYVNINVESSWNGSQSGFGNYTFHSILHEIGHGLGLGHQGNYNTSASYSNSSEVIFENDNWQTSVMSYIDQTENTSITADYAYLSSFMTSDLIAIDDLYSSFGYGISNAFSGDTTYGFNTNIASSTSSIFNEMTDWLSATAFTIVDGSGTDTIDFSGFSNQQTIDLRASEKSASNLYSSNIDGDTGNLIIAPGTVIENAIGGNANDTLIGNSSSNNLTGNGGADTISGGDGDDILHGNGGADTLNGEGGNDTLNGNNASDVLNGGNGDDTLNGNNGDDNLDGGTGNDTMVGGTGDDTYTVDSASDVVTENSSEGTDLIQSSVTFKASANVENLTLTGSSNIDATGNSLNNTLTGNSGNNTLDGGSGDDTMVGGTGDDTYTVDSTSDVVTESSSEGTDLIQSSVTFTASANVENLTLTGSSNIDATGNSLNNTLTGNSGDNILNGNNGDDNLDGGTGDDTMVGGTGNDTYTVDSASDVVTENSSEGTDLIQSSVTFTASANVENLTLTGSSNIDATGNSLNNTLTGNSGNNTLNGGTGDDTMVGGTGNDTYTVDSASDVVTENSSEGTDLIQSSVTFTASANVENLTLTGSSNIDATGNSLNNTLTGNSGNNTLDGGTGDDIAIFSNNLSDYSYTINSGDIQIIGEGTDTLKNIENIQFNDVTKTESQLRNIADIPSISSLYPTDNSTSVLLDSNLILTFSEAVETKTGSITIYKSFNDEIFESFDVSTSPLITGSGTKNITINPTINFSESTEYYIKIDSTAFDDSVNNSYSGISNKTDFNIKTVSNDGSAIYAINGLPTGGSTLSIKEINADPDGNGSLSYNWEISSDGDSWSSVSTSSEYTLTASDEGKLIKVNLTYIDGEGFSESINAKGFYQSFNFDNNTSFSSLGVKSINPASGNSENFDITFSAASNTSTWGYAGGFARSSQSNFDSYSFEYEGPYSDTNKSFSEGEIVIFQNNPYTIVQIFNSSSRSHGDSIDGVDIRYTFFENDNSGSGWNEAQRILYSDSGDAVFAISGTTQVDQALSITESTADPDGTGTLSYVWQSSSDETTWSQIGTDSTYTLTSSEEGKKVRAIISYTDAQGFSESVTTSTVDFSFVDDGDAFFAISGTIQVGQSLSITESTADPDGTGTLSYVWQSSSDETTWSPIGTDSTYTLTSSEEGKKVKAIISYTDAQGFSESVTTSTVDLIDDGDATFTISGSPQFGQALSITESTADPDGAGTLSYVWQSSADETTWTQIGTDSTYTVTSTEEGKKVRVIVSYKDGHGFSESVTASAIDISIRTYSLTTEINSPQEGYELTTTASTENITEGSTLYWSLSGTDISITDFASGSLTGSGTVGSDGTFSFKHSIASDGDTEGYETIDIKLFSDSERTTQVGDTKSILIRDSAIEEKIAEIVEDLNGVKQVVSQLVKGQNYTLNNIRDYDGNLHANSADEDVSSSYKYQHALDVNGDGTLEAIYTNMKSGRWVTASINPLTGKVDYSDYGQDGTTRVVGIYDDPLIAEGAQNNGYLSDGITPAPANFGVSDADRYVQYNGETVDRLALNSQVRFQNDLKIDNLIAKKSNDFDSDGIREVYWKTSDGTAYLRALMHADGNIRYANYQSESQMSEYLTNNGLSDSITEIIS